MVYFIKKVFHFFDRLEDHIRSALSRTPIIYTFIGGVAIVLFWKGVWDTADMFPFLSGPVNIIISVTVLLLTGLFVSFFVGDVIILSGVRNEKKIIEKTENEIKEEEVELSEIKAEMDVIKHLIEKHDK